MGEEEDDDDRGGWERRMEEGFWAARCCIAKLPKNLPHWRILWSSGRMEEDGGRRWMRQEKRHAHCPYRVRAGRRQGAQTGLCDNRRVCLRQSSLPVACGRIENWIQPVADAACGAPRTALENPPGEKVPPFPWVLLYLISMSRACSSPPSEAREELQPEYD